ncbi:hypothetical protein VTI74DRAFT_2320 [Chaetomium olivicolor]
MNTILSPSHDYCHCLQLHYAMEAIETSRMTIIKSSLHRPSVQHVYQETVYLSHFKALFIHFNHPPSQPKTNLELILKVRPTHLCNRNIR